MVRAHLAFDAACVKMNVTTGFARAGVYPHNVQHLLSTYSGSLDRLRAGGRC